MRKCIGCEQEFPLTTDYFPKRRNNNPNEDPDGYKFQPRCRTCQRIYNAEMKRRERQRKRENK